MAAHPRRWFKINFPMFLDVILIGYVYLTLAILSESALRREFARTDIRMKHESQPLYLNAFGTFLARLGLFRAGTLVGWPHDIVIAVLLSGMTLIALHRAALGDPGQVPEYYRAPLVAGAERASMDAVAVTVAPMQLNQQFCTPLRWPSNAEKELRLHSHYCKFCDRDRPPRAHHCRVCDICVVRFDHHCDWIDNCVGQCNHKCFMLFIIYISLCIYHYSAMLVRYFANSTSVVAPQAHGNVWSVVHFVIIIFYSFIVFPCAILATGFLFTTVYQLLRDQTTAEAAHPNRRPDTAKVPVRSSWLSSVKLVMGPRVAWWWWPDLQPLQLGPSTASETGFV